MGPIRKFVDRAALWLGFGLDEEGESLTSKKPTWFTSIDWPKAIIGASALSLVIRWLDGQVYVLAGSPEIWLWHYLPVTATAGLIHLLIQLDKLGIPEVLKKWFVPTAIGLGAMLIYRESLNLLLYFLFPTPA